MKKQLFFINNQNGFYLPLVLFITSLIFIMATSNIAIYQSDLEITKNQVEQIKIETLFQMARGKIKEDIAPDIENFKVNDKMTYYFPDGIVDILILGITDSNYELLYTINTKEQSIYFINNILQIYE